MENQSSPLPELYVIDKGTTQLFESGCESFLKDLRGDYSDVRPLGGLSITPVNSGLQSERFLVVQVIVYGAELQ
jgi:hypothetical protein